MLEMLHNLTSIRIFVATKRFFERIYVRLYCILAGRPVLWTGFKITDNYGAKKGGTYIFTYYDFGGVG